MLKHRFMWASLQGLLSCLSPICAATLLSVVIAIAFSITTIIAWLHREWNAKRWDNAMMEHHSENCHASHQCVVTSLDCFLLGKGPSKNSIDIVTYQHCCLLKVSEPTNAAVQFLIGHAHLSANEIPCILVSMKFVGVIHVIGRWG